MAPVCCEADPRSGVTLTSALCWSAGSTLTRGGDFSIVRNVGLLGCSPVPYKEAPRPRLFLRVVLVCQPHAKLGCQSHFARLSLSRRCPSSQRRRWLLIDCCPIVSERFLANDRVCIVIKAAEACQLSDLLTTSARHVRGQHPKTHTGHASEEIERADTDSGPHRPFGNDASTNSLLGHWTTKRCQRMFPAAACWPSSTPWLL